MGARGRDGRAPARLGRALDRRRPRRARRDALDFALVAHGLASQGLDATSAWRPALQVLPARRGARVRAARSLPRDGAAHVAAGSVPGSRRRRAGERARRGPRDRRSGVAASQGANRRADAREGHARGGRVGRRSRRRGGPRRRERRSTAGDDRDLARAARTRRVEARATRRAPRRRGSGARTWLRPRLAAAQKSAGGDPTNAGLAARADILVTAFARAEAFHETLSHESRADLDLVDARLLLEQVSSGHTLVLATEAAGRLDPVDSPAALRRARDVVVWWHCVSGTEWRPSVRPWRRAELHALRDAGVVLPDSAERLAVEAGSWHQPIHAARKRLVLAMPRWAAGEALDPHPVWHEMAARFRATSADLARITIEARDLLAGRVAALGQASLPAVTDAGPLALPAGTERVAPRPRRTSARRSGTARRAWTPSSAAPCNGCSSTRRAFAPGRWTRFRERAAALRQARSPSGRGAAPQGGAHGRRCAGRGGGFRAWSASCARRRPCSSARA